MRRSSAGSRACVRCRHRSALRSSAAISDRGSDRAINGKSVFSVQYNRGDREIDSTRLIATMADRYSALAACGQSAASLCRRNRGRGLHGRIHIRPPSQPEAEHHVPAERRKPIPTATSTPDRYEDGCAATAAIGRKRAKVAVQAAGVSVARALQRRPDEGRRAKNMPPIQTMSGQVANNRVV